MQGQVQIGDYVLDHGSRELRGPGRVRLLEPKEYGVFALLVQHAPNAVTREQALRHVWSGAVVGDNALHQVIVRLRRALRDDARHPVYIKTLPKVGYRLVAPVHMPLAASASSSVAVMRFTNYADKAEHRYVADGLALEIGRELTLRGVEVAQPLQVLKLQDDDRDAATIFRQTGARYSVCGSVMTSSARLRVLATLTDAARGRHMWCEGFDGNTAELFDAQQCLATGIARQVQAVLDAVSPAPILDLAV